MPYSFGPGLQGWGTCDALLGRAYPPTAKGSFSDAKRVDLNVVGSRTTPDRS